MQRIISDIELLSNYPNELVNSYNRLTIGDFSISELQEYDMNNFEAIINNYIETKPEMKGILSQVYYRDQLQKFVIEIINNIVNKRNKIVTAGIFEEFKTEKKLDNLVKSIDYLLTCNKVFYIQNYRVNMNEINEAIKNKLRELKSTIENDKKVLPIYAQRKIEALGNYTKLKNEYDRKSKFAQFLAKFNGEEKQLIEARLKSSSFGGIKASLQAQNEFGISEIDNTMPNYEQIAEELSGRSL